MPTDPTPSVAAAAEQIAKVALSPYTKRSDFAAAIAPILTALVAGERKIRDLHEEVARLRAHLKDAEKCAQDYHDSYIEAHGILGTGHVDHAHVLYIEQHGAADLPRTILGEECLALVKRLSKKDAQLATARAALEYYAEKGIYQPDTNQAEPIAQTFPPEIERDEGETARRVLRGLADDGG